ncbi:MAG: hypothetical protein ACXWWM_05135 [Candidatus Deferrimicrobiaceae bacterium]
MTPGGQEKKRRSGSRLLLAAALAGGVIAAFIAGARFSDFLCDVLGITSTPVRLGLKVASIALALPAVFFLVERFFLRRAKPSGAQEGGSPEQKPD